MAKVKIVVKLMGGLGNQMFQYASALALANRLNGDLFVDKQYFSVDFKLKNTPRKYNLDVFKVAPGFYRHFLLSNLFFQRLSNKFSLVRRILLLFNIAYLTDRDDIDLIAEARYRCYYLDGYWQHKAFFKELQQELTEAFQFKTELDYNNKAILPVLAAQNSVAVHVRRTDYLLPESCHVVLGSDYYQAAINLIKAEVPSPAFYFFGDDHEWIRSTFNIDNESMILVKGNEGALSYMDMFLISQCKHKVISNSTFSFWGAFLSAYPQGITIAPVKWFLPGKASMFNQSELLPDQWLKI